MFKGLGGLGDMAKMMKAAQEMQQKVTDMQEELHTIMVTGESGAGLVKATASAKGDLKALDIDPSIFNGDDKGPHRDALLMGTSLVLEVQGAAKNAKQGVEMAAAALDDGAAAEFLGNNRGDLSGQFRGDPCIQEQDP